MVSSPRGVRRIEFLPESPHHLTVRERESPLLAESAGRRMRPTARERVRVWSSEAAAIARLLNRYFKGGKPNLRRAPADTRGMSPFQLGVLRAAQAIPYGEVRSYGWVAARIGRPRAARAVGRALATNPLPLVFPCHRVVASDGSLGGFSSGLAVKRKLLALEGARGLRYNRTPNGRLNTEI
ncbi:MAG: MGMT family protein [Nitrospirae bacterium]|nr:MGMT family protein [Nitrospirota bacterium]